jgi:hypothetical protein
MTGKQDWVKMADDSSEKSPLTKRGVQPEINEEDLRYDVNLRPKCLDEYIGQEHWTMSFFADLLDWGKQPWLTSSPANCG